MATAVNSKAEQERRDVEAIQAAVNEWNTGLDGGDLERMIATCDPDPVTCNDGVPTVVGQSGIREKYAPRIASSVIKSEFDYEHVKVYGDVAIVVGYFAGEMTDKASGKVRNSSGRLALVYQRDTEGSWKMILDMDNAGGGL